LPILDRELRRFKWIWIAIACLIALSRLYFGVHYLSDVIFGGIFGYVIGRLVLAITERRKQ
jgi:undecaprenyl-diphosphatase